MKANLTYSIISAELKQGMYLLVNDHLGYISRMNAEKAIISFYYEDGKVIKLGKQEMTREDAISTYSTSVIKLIAIVEGNPVSINHQNYKKIFSPMLTFEKGADESYISQFIKTKEWANPIYGDISPVYSMLKVGDIVNIRSLPIVDAYSLYDPMKRLVRVKSKKGNSKYIVVRMDNECEDDFEITVEYLLDIASKSYSLFKSSGIDKKRRILKLLFPNFIYDGENLHIYLNSAFEGMLKNAICRLNLGRKDSNLRMAGPKPAALPLGDVPILVTSIILYDKTLLSIIIFPKVIKWAFFNSS